MINSDQLRTRLANERTLLAYIRTALASWIFGLAVIKLFSGNFIFVSLGWMVIVSGTAILFWGILKFNERHKEI